MTMDISPMFLSSITDNNLTDLTMGNTTLFIRNRNCLPLASIWVHSRFWRSPCCYLFVVFCAVLCFFLFLFYLSSFFVLGPMVPVSLGCLYLILCLGSNVACISGLFILDSLSWSNVACISGLFILDSLCPMFIRNRNCLPLASIWVHSRFWRSPCCYLFVVFCAVLCFFLFLFYLSSFFVLGPMLPVSLGCLYLILCLGSNVACISGLFILDSLSWVQCCLYLWVVYT